MFSKPLFLFSILLTLCCAQSNVLYASYDQQFNGDLPAVRTQVAPAELDSPLPQNLATGIYDAYCYVSSSVLVYHAVDNVNNPQYSLVLMMLSGIVFRKSTLAKYLYQQLWSCIPRDEHME